MDHSASIDVLAVGSHGGHWVELLLLEPALCGLSVAFLSSHATGQEDVPAGSLFVAVPDANLRTPLKAMSCLWQVIRVIRSLRPRVVLSTGAAPGLFAVLVGRALGAKTIWVESLCGVSRLTVSGRLARCFVSRFFVQWPELAADDAEYHGNLL
jgi:UDP-N-acetylglucosamine:LPS N-acetylglucosamine transferase